MLGVEAGGVGDGGAAHGDRETADASGSGAAGAEVVADGAADHAMGAVGHQGSEAAAYNQ